MPPKKTEDKISDMLEEALFPIKETLKELITNDKMAQMISDLEEKLLGKIKEQEEKIKNVKSICSQLEGRVAILENLAKIQERKADDVEQYGRRLCLRVDNFPLRANETPKGIEHELHREFTNMGLKQPEEAIDMAHRVGKRYEVEEEDEDGVVTGVTKQQVIVRFTSWTHRTLVYRSRKKSKNFKFKIDLTKRRMGLLSHARRLIKDIQGIDYAFSDVNCRLNLKLCGGPFRAFNSETELASIIADLDNC